MRLDADDGSLLSGRVCDVALVNRTAGYEGHVAHSTPDSAATSQLATARRLTDVGLGIAERLSSLEAIAGVLDSPARSGPDEWVPSHLGNGLAGIGLLHVECAASTGDDAHLGAALTMLRSATDYSRVAPFQRIGFLGGASGFAFVLDRFADLDPRLRRSAERFRNRLVDDILGMLLPYGDPWMREADFDLVSGAAGALGYLVWAGDRSAPALLAADRLVAYLSWHFEGATLDSRAAALPALSFAGSPYAERFPDGVLNPGLAHGLAGALRALGAAWAVWGDPRARHALDRAARDLARAYEDAGAGPHGPIAFAPSGGHVFHRPIVDPVRAATWCSGVTGVALALADCARSTGDPRFDALSRVLEPAPRDPAADGPLPGGLCHGSWGTALAAHYLSVHRDGRQARDMGIEGDPDVASPAFLDGDPAALVAADPSFLTGAAGIGLAAMALASPGKPDWARLLF